mmetsp:Transcript_10374/g.32136  ORF Transcript_10374/g.32136 Transcript_10374/m.32136 type:complete len:222 (+) Transcript_10374:81-746(+)
MTCTTSRAPSSPPSRSPASPASCPRRCGRGSWSSSMRRCRAPRLGNSGCRSRACVPSRCVWRCASRRACCRVSCTSTRRAGRTDSSTPRPSSSGKKRWTPRCAPTAPAMTAALAEPHRPRPLHWTPPTSCWAATRWCCPSRPARSPARCARASPPSRQSSDSHRRVRLPAKLWPLRRGLCRPDRLRGGRTSWRRRVCRRSGAPRTCGASRPSSSTSSPTSR